jgi:hypothetical protein
MRDATAVILPATAVDFSGNRIGQGGGYYDKFLAALAAMSPASGAASDAVALPTAAVVYDTEVLPAGSIPAESFVPKVDVALAPGGVPEAPGGPGGTVPLPESAPPSTAPGPGVPAVLPAANQAAAPITTTASRAKARSQGRAGVVAGLIAAAPRRRREPRTPG